VATHTPLLHDTTSIAAEVQQLLSNHGATAVMVGYDQGDPIAMKFKILVDIEELDSRMPIDGKAVVQGMRQHYVARQRLCDGSVHVRGWEPSPRPTQISLEYLTAAFYPLRAPRSSRYEAPRALPGHDFIGSTATGAPCPAADLAHEATRGLRESHTGPYTSMRVGGYGRHADGAVSRLTAA
jgi:hypothetical protein